MQEKITIDQLKTALNALTKLEVLHTTIDKLPYKDPQLKVDKRNMDFEQLRELAKKPVTQQTAQNHLKNIENAISWLEKKTDEVRGSMSDNKAQMLVQLDAALDRALSTQGYLLKGDFKNAEEGLRYLINWQLRS